MGKLVVKLKYWCTTLAEEYIKYRKAVEQEKAKNIVTFEHNCYNYYSRQQIYLQNKTAKIIHIKVIRQVKRQFSNFSKHA